MSYFSLVFSKIVSSSLISAVSIWHALVQIFFWYGSFLVLSETPLSIVWCPISICGNSPSLLLLIFLLFLFPFFLLGFSLCVCNAFVFVPQFLDILFHLLQYFFFSSLWSLLEVSLTDPQAHRCFSSSMFSIPVSPSKAFFSVTVILNTNFSF